MQEYLKKRRKEQRASHQSRIPEKSGSNPSPDSSEQVPEQPETQTGMVNVFPDHPADRNSGLISRKTFLIGLASATAAAVIGGIGGILSHDDNNVTHSSEHAAPTPVPTQEKKNV